VKCGNRTQKAIRNDLESVILLHFLCKAPKGAKAVDMWVTHARAVQADL